jgi:hypothetical protein
MTSGKKKSSIRANSATISPRGNRLLPLELAFPYYEVFPVVITYIPHRSKKAKFSRTLPLAGRMKADGFLFLLTFAALEPLS